MKALGLKANVDREKIFPHNLRHLFARTYYAMTKDLSKLADYWAIRISIRPAFTPLRAGADTENSWKV